MNSQSRLYRHHVLNVRQTLNDVKLKGNKIPFKNLGSPFMPTKKEQHPHFCDSLFSIKCRRIVSCTVKCCLVIAGNFWYVGPFEYSTDLCIMKFTFVRLSSSHFISRLLNFWRNMFLMASQEKTRACRRMAETLTIGSFSKALFE